MYSAAHEPHIRMLLYSGHEEEWANGTLVQLWQWMQEEPHARHLWADGEVVTLNTFIRHFSLTENRILFLPLYQTAGKVEIMGCAWIDELTSSRATAHYFFRRPFWGEGRPLIAIRRGLEMLFAPPFSFSLICGRTVEKNVFARGLLRRLGMREAGVIPGWYQHRDGSSHGAVLSYFQKEEFVTLWDPLPPAVEEEAIEARELSHA